MDVKALDKLLGSFKLLLKTVATMITAGTTYEHSLCWKLYIHFLDQGWQTMVVSEPLPGVVNKSLKHGQHALLFTCCLWLL